MEAKRYVKFIPRCVYVDDKPLEDVRILLVNEEIVRVIVIVSCKEFYAFAFKKRRRKVYKETVRRRAFQNTALQLRRPAQIHPPFFLEVQTRHRKDALKAISGWLGVFFILRLIGGSCPWWCLGGFWRGGL